MIFTFTDSCSSICFSSKVDLRDASIKPITAAPLIRNRQFNEPTLQQETSLHRQKYTFKYKLSS